MDLQLKMWVHTNILAVAKHGSHSSKAFSFPTLPDAGGGRVAVRGGLRTRGSPVTPCSQLTRLHTEWGGPLASNLPVVRLPGHCSAHVRC